MAAFYARLENPCCDSRAGEPNFGDAKKLRFMGGANLRHRTQFTLASLCMFTAYCAVLMSILATGRHFVHGASHP